ncbi:MAG: DUF4142 domain-containing protein [Polyangiaceae bacterium]
MRTGLKIEQAKLARSKSKNARVQQFASMILAHHSEAQKKQAKLRLTTAESPLSADLTQQANQVLTSLKDKAGAEFDKTYMKAQIDEHGALLTLIDSQLLPAVKNPELKAYLEEVRSRVEQHLEVAQATQNQLDARPARMGNAAGSIP